MNKNDSHRAALNDRRATIRQEIVTTLQRVDADRYGALAEQVHDTKDQAIAKALAESENAELRRAAAELQDIDSALQRVDAGTYGRCVVCGNVIPEPRLAAYPTAKRCLPCQTHHEQKR